MTVFQKKSARALPGAKPLRKRSCMRLFPLKNSGVMKFYNYQNYILEREEHL